MTDENTPTLQDIAADRDWWSQEAGAQAARNLPQMQPTLHKAGVDRACPPRRAEGGSPEGESAAGRLVSGGPPAWIFWTIVGLSALVVMLVLVKV